MKFAFTLTMSLSLVACSEPRGFVHLTIEVPGAPGSVAHLEMQDSSFIEAIPAWNLLTPDPQTPSVLWRTGQRCAEQLKWTNWTPINVQESPSTDTVVKLDIDTITGDFDIVELKLADDAQTSGSLSLTATGSRRGARITPSRGTWVEIDVPHRSQRTDDPALKGRLCSPASLAMVCAFYGEDIDVATLAREAYDASHDIYGNWPRNLQAVHRLSEGRLEARFARMSTFHELRELLEHGTPVVISIKGHLAEAPYSPTAGHLLVVRGMTAEGNILVVDPAFSEPTQANRIYSASDLARAWLVNRRGTAYVVTRKPKP